MGKGEELHMELEFDRDVIHCWEIAADGTLCQEETLETIVPDAWSGHPPHRGGMRTGDTEREAGPGGAAAVSGSVRAVLLYQPEEGGGCAAWRQLCPSPPKWRPRG